MDRSAIHFIPHLAPLSFVEHPVIIILKTNGPDDQSVFKEKVVRVTSDPGKGIHEGEIIAAC